MFAKIREPAIILTKGTDIVAQMLRTIFKKKNDFIPKLEAFVYQNKNTLFCLL